MRYPTADYNISFLAQKFSRVYGDAAEFRSKLFNMDDLISNPNITPSDYKKLYPLFLFDFSKQNILLQISKLRCILAQMYPLVPKPMLLL